MPSVVIVEDELIAAEYLKQILEANGAEVLAVIDSGQEAIRRCIELRPDVIFMDIMLRDNVSGSEAAVAISREIPAKIVFLTAYVDPEMVDYAVEAKAAAYLTKPYNEGEIIATLRLVTLSKPAEPAPLATAELPPEIRLKHGYRFDSVHHRVLKGGKEIELGPKALQMIELLCTQPDISVSNEQISMHVWGELVNDRTLRSLVFRIRAVLGDDVIKNVSGSGYKIQTE